MAKSLLLILALGVAVAVATPGVYDEYTYDDDKDDAAYVEYEDESSESDISDDELNKITDFIADFEYDDDDDATPQVGRTLLPQRNRLIGWRRNGNRLIGWRRDAKTGECECTSATTCSCCSIKGDISSACVFFEANPSSQELQITLRMGNHGSISTNVKGNGHSQSCNTVNGKQFCIKSGSFESTPNGFKGCAEITALGNTSTKCMNYNSNGQSSITSA